MILTDLYNNGKKLEWFSNSCFQTLGYYIDTNLKVTEDKINASGSIDILEIDIYAKVFKKLGVETTLIECKGGCTFNDIHLFKGVASVINADNNGMVVTSKQIEDIKAHAQKLQIEIYEPLELFNKIETKDKVIFQMYYFWNDMKDTITSKKYIEHHLVNTIDKKLSKEQNNAYGEVRSYYSNISGKVWREPDLVKRAKRLLELQQVNKDFVRKVARTQKIKPLNRNSQYYIDSNEICQAAGSLVLDVRIAYIVCAVECAISNIDTMLEIDDLGFNNLVKKLSSEPEIAFLIPKFLQFFINIFGGVYFKDNRDIYSICYFMNITVSQFNKVMNLLEEMFTLPELGIQWGFEEDMLVKCLKYTPSIYKAIGVKNREKLNINTEVFVNKSLWKEKLNNLEGFKCN